MRILENIYQSWPKRLFKNIFFRNELLSRFESLLRGLLKYYNSIFNGLQKIFDKIWAWARIDVRNAWKCLDF